MTDEQIVSDLELVKVPRRDKAYKWRYQLYKKIAFALGGMLLGIGYLLFLTLMGNLSLQRQLAEKPAFMIMPNGRMLTSK